MAALRPCVEYIVAQDGQRRPCGELSQFARCAEHKRRYEKKRLVREPWRFLYDDPRWSKVRLSVFARDGYQCTHQVGTRRCITTALLECHHEEKLRHIWARLGSPQRGSENWEAFMRAACDTRNLRTLCHACHKLIDNNNPDEVWLGKPGDKARSSVSRGIRSRKKRSLDSKKPKRPTRGELRERRDED